MKTFPQSFTATVCVTEEAAQVQQLNNDSPIAPHKKGELRFRKVSEKQNFDTRGTMEEIIFSIFKWNYMLHLWKTQTPMLRLVYRNRTLPTKALAVSAEVKAEYLLNYL